MSAGLQLRSGALTVLLGPAEARRAVLADLDDGSARCGSGHAVPQVARLAPAPYAPASDRVLDLQLLALRGCALLLADGLTTGLGAQDRRTVLAALAALQATGTAVLADEPDPLALLAVADSALRVQPDGRLRIEAL